MRGALELFTERVIRSGIIPAYAGSTIKQQQRSEVARDHPRICGEHDFTRLSFADGTGSSPHMRGALYYVDRDIHPSGIIPAYAGSTRSDTLPCGEIRDHPRICGKHLTLFGLI